MSPEQCRGAGHVDHRTDIYALSCVIFEMATGRPPFVGEGPGDVIGAHLFHEPPSLAGCLPPQMADLVARLLAKLPADRVQSMSDVLVTLANFTGATGRPMSPPKVPLTAGPEQRTAAEVVSARPPSLPTPTNLQPSATVYAYESGVADTDADTLKRRASTTLGASAGQSVARIPAPLRRASWAIGGIFVMASAAGGVSLVHRLSGSPPVVVAPLPPPKMPEPPPKPTQYTMTISTTPPGADVFNGMERLGTTPRSVALPASDAPLVLIFKKKGYKDAPFTITPNRDHDIVTELVSLPRAHAQSSSRPSTQSAAPARTEAAAPTAVPPVPKPASMRDLKDPFN